MKATKLLADLLRWEANMGGFEARCWRRAKRFMRRQRCRVAEEQKGEVAGYVVRNGYHRADTGDFYLFLGRDADGLLAFWRPFEVELLRANLRRTRQLFSPYEHEQPEAAIYEEEFSTGCEVLRIETATAESEAT